jgi:hypothetical protein
MYRLGAGAGSSRGEGASKAVLLHGFCTLGAAIMS